MRLQPLASPLLLVLAFAVPGGCARGPRPNDSVALAADTSSRTRVPEPTVRPASSTLADTARTASVPADTIPRARTDTPEKPRDSASTASAARQPARNNAPDAAAKPAAGAEAKPAASDVSPRRDAAAARRLPFAFGERLEYQVKFGSVSVGRASMEVLGLDTVRGREVYHTMFNVRGGVLMYKVNDRYESWFDPFTFSSRRFRQDIDQGSYERRRVFEIFPERAVYVEEGKPEAPSVPQPLDEASFIYFLRTMPLEVGRTYDLHRYFRPDRNPVRVEVLRKERISVPAGTFNTIVVRPVIKTPGIFSEGGRAEIWFTDDSVRTMVQMKSRLKFGSLNLYLRSIRPGELK